MAKVKKVKPVKEEVDLVKTLKGVTNIWGEEYVSEDEDDFLLDDF